MPPNVNLASLVPLLITLVNIAGKCICGFYKRELKVFEKKDNSPVTLADQQSHLILKEGLEKLLPSVPVISEEDPLSWGIQNPLYWLVDPLDGTAGFIRKSKEFCINIALMQNNHPIFGLIHLPLSQETFYGYEGKAWLHVKGKTISIHTQSIPTEGMTLLLGGYGKKHTSQEKDFLKNYPITNIKRIQSALKFCMMASGKADIYLRFEPCFEWDTAAGQALVEAAGGTVTNLDGSPFMYGKPHLLNKAFIVLGNKK